MSAPVEKKQKLEGAGLLIGTHSGTFHCDEALAVSLLRSLPKFSNSTLIRTRDQAKLDECDIVVDVGSVYDHEKMRYDHHQRGFMEVFGEAWKTKLSSAGLVYKHYGQEIISNFLNLSEDSPTIPILYHKLYDEFIEGIDGVDNGVTQYVSSISTSGEKPAPAKSLYKTSTTLSTRVGWLNPRWNEELNDAILDAKFEKASKMCGEEFFDRLDYFAKAWLPAREIVVSALEDRKMYEEEGRIVVFPTFCPWKEHLHILESDLDLPLDKQILYVLYPDEAGSAWRIQAVPKGPDSFESRKALPEPWRGVRDEKLSEISGIEGGVFVHAAGFIGGNKTKEGALAMAMKAVKDF